MRNHQNSLYAEPSMLRYIYENFDYKSAVIVSPDAGGAKRFNPQPTLLSRSTNIHVTVPLLSPIV